MIQKAFEPFELERVTLTLRYLLSVSKLRFYRTGSYSGYRVLIGELLDQNSSPIILVLKPNEPYAYVGKVKKHMFNIFEYDIEKYPPVNFDNNIVRYETALPKFFLLKNDIGTILNKQPSVQFNDYIKNKWHRLPIDSNNLMNKEFNGPWAWTYELDFNKVNGINVIYCKSDKDIPGAI